jgi:O-antigen ligase
MMRQHDQFASEPDSSILWAQVDSSVRSAGKVSLDEPSPVVSGAVLSVGCGLILLLALTLGGGTRQGLWSDAVAQLAAIPLLLAALWYLPGNLRRPGALIALFLLAAVATLPLLQLIPLPPALWADLPGRTRFAQTYEAVGLQIPWLGISLAPAATWRVFFALIPSAAVFLALFSVDRRNRQLLALGLVVFAFISVLLGLAQVAQGDDSPLRFYELSNRSDPVGFFTNRNHYAALLYCGLPFTAAFATGFATDRRREVWIVLALCVFVFATLLLGLGMSRSRAGLALAMLSGFGSLIIAITGSKRSSGKRAHRLIFLGAFAGFFLVLQFASIGILQRLQTDVAEDLRWELAATTFKAARDFLPFGSGFGSFPAIYAIYEGPQQVYDKYANHAHNDYAELLLEGGVAAVAAIALALLWFARLGIRSWRAPDARFLSALDVGLPKAGAIVVFLLLVHSAVDYPLRTTALSTLFSFACGLLVLPNLSDNERKLGLNEERVSGAKPAKKRPWRNATRSKGRKRSTAGR